MNELSNEKIYLCPKCGTVYKKRLEDLSDKNHSLSCPKLTCDGIIIPAEPFAVPIISILSGNGFVVNDMHIGAAINNDTEIRLDFADLYNFQPLPEGFELVAPINPSTGKAYNHADTRPMDIPVSIVKYFSTYTGSIREFYVEWAKALAEITLWALAMPAPANY